MGYIEDISGRWEYYYNRSSTELMALYIIHKRTHIRLEGCLRRLILDYLYDLDYDATIDFTYDRLFITTYGEKFKEEVVNHICKEFDLIFECLIFDCVIHDLKDEVNCKQLLNDNNIEYRYVFEFKRYLEAGWLKKLKEVDDKYLK